MSDTIFACKLVFTRKLASKSVIIKTALNKIFNILTVSFLVLTCAFVILYVNTHLGIFLTLAITFGTFTYHFSIRLLVAFLINSLPLDFDPNSKWFHVGPREISLFERLGVKCWKKNLPTYDKRSFDTKTNSWKEILQVMCKSEVVHEFNVVLSFLPIIAGVWFGAFPVFIITSIAAATFDFLFVIVQRYNRPRVIALLRRKTNQV